jgi:capsule polysaccharide export protein KpsE/RkpR
VGVFDKDPESAKAMVDYYVSLLDNAVQKLFNENARNNRIFIEKRLHQNKEELQIDENKLASFQQKHGIFQPDEQVLLSLKIAADLEADLMAEEIKLGLAQKMYSKGSQEIIDLQLRIDEIQKKLNEMKRGSGNHITNESFLMRFDKAPELALEYVRLLREVEIKSKLLEYLIPIYEKAKIDEMKDTPSLLVIDEPQVPEYKSKPKRAYIVIGAFLFSLMFSLAVVLFRNYYQNFYENADENLKSKLRYIKSHIPAWRQHKM